MNASGPCNILYIEDDEDDILLFRHAFAKSRIPCKIQNVESVEEAEAYLTGGKGYSDRAKCPLPHIIITDLAFRDESGIDFMNWLRYHPEFASIPVLCLTGTEDPRKLEQARSFGATCIQKSSVYQDVMDVIERTLEQQKG